MIHARQFIISQKQKDLPEYLQVRLSDGYFLSYHKELPVYVVIAAGLSFLVLELTTESFLVPVFFLLSIGTAIVYNLGSNVFLGQVSYITKALTAVLQLGVTMDYSIFLLNSFEENKRRFPDDRTTAMGFAISNTFRSIVGSSVTTIAGFAALCFMTFALGKDLGIVMAIVSSFRNRPVDEKTIVFGEVGLSGEVRAVNMPEQRVAEAKKLGFETCILPEVSLKMVKGIKGIKLVGVKNIGDAVREI